MKAKESENYMHQCLNLAKTALTSGNPPVGALIVLDGDVIGTGIESGKSTGDITNHAEIIAIRDAIKMVIQTACIWHKCIPRTSPASCAHI